MTRLPRPLRPSILVLKHLKNGNISVFTKGRKLTELRTMDDVEAFKRGWAAAEARGE